VVNACTTVSGSWVRIVAEGSLPVTVPGSVAVTNPDHPALRYDVENDGAKVGRLSATRRAYIAAPIAIHMSMFVAY